MPLPLPTKCEPHSTSYLIFPNSRASTGTTLDVAIACLPELSYLKTGSTWFGPQVTVQKIEKVRFERIDVDVRGY